MFKYKIYKYCPTCELTKYATEFSNNKSRGDGLCGYCRDCVRKRGMIHYYKNIERIKLRSRQALVKRKYGIEFSEYQRKIFEQNDLCFICQKPEKIKSKSLAIDHNHATGEVRKLLCHNCNLMLGYSCDDPELLRAAANYLEQHEKIS